MRSLSGNVNFQLKMTDADSNIYNQGKEFNRPASL